MNIRRPYLAAGVSWGALLGILVGLAANVFVFGAGWPDLIGGDTEPVPTGRGLPVSAILTGLVTFAACTAAGWVAGGRAEASGVDRRRARRFGLGLLGLWAVAALVLVGVVIVGVEQEEIDQQTAAAQENAFSRLYAQRHTVTRIDFFGWNAERGSAGIVLHGNRSGDYQIGWRVTETKSGQVLAEGRQAVTLELGRRIVVIPLDRSSLITAYRKSVLPGAAGEVVDGVFRLTATVEPVPSPAERSTLPPQELQTLSIGQSTLRSTGFVDMPVSFPLSAAPTASTD
jgi:hypothetical protein